MILSLVYTDGGIAECSQNLCVANCGLAVGLSFDVIASVFKKFGEVRGVYAADESGNRVIVCFDSRSSAKSAMEALHGRSCPLLGCCCLHIRYSVQSSDPVRKIVSFLSLFLRFCNLLSWALVCGILPNVITNAIVWYTEVFILWLLKRIIGIGKFPNIYFSFQM